MTVYAIAARTGTARMKGSQPIWKTVKAMLSAILLEILYVKNTPNVEVMDTVIRTLNSPS
ncbi:hypothetical protein D3C81_2316450 [compost metagenome]